MIGVKNVNLFPYFEAFMHGVSVLLILAGLVLMVWALDDLAKLHDNRAVEDETFHRRNREWPGDDV